MRHPEAEQKFVDGRLISLCNNHNRDDCDPSLRAAIERERERKS